MTSKNKPNGSYSTKHGANGCATSSGETRTAASVDASGLPVATTAASPAAAGADHSAFAEVAAPAAAAKRSHSEGTAPPPKPRKGRKEPRIAGEPSADEVDEDVPPGSAPLPIDGEAFVDAVHRQVDLVQLEVKLLKSKDEKIIQRELASLRELRYGKHAIPADEESPQFVFDMSDPEGDKP